jgi:hypothetical protein
MRDLLTIDIETEPRGAGYRTLLEAGLEICDRCLLVVRERSWLDRAGLRILASLQPHIRGEASQAEWPGTILSGGQAEVFTYEYRREVVDLLVGAVDGLYDWVAPLPEDLCLLRGRDPWLVSTAHERDAYLRFDDGIAARLTIDTRSRLREHLPLPTELWEA